MFQRVGEAKTLLQARKLLQQYIVDGWASAEQEHLQWVQLHQRELQAELYHQVRDTFAGLDDNINPQEVGRQVILPAIFNGSVRDMMENLQNSLAISRCYGVADLFVTMTANPKWQEIVDELFPG